jgi:2',3'-cyclic-nucleotide 2'-phosphodiesterase (5'-nucleotidase family)
LRIVADAMVEKANQIAPEINHHAFLQAAWFRYNFPVNTEGNSVLFTEYHIDKIDAFNEYLVIMQLTGEQIYQSIEQGVYKLKLMQSGGLLHVDDHIKYVYDASKEPGRRIMFISIHGEPLIKNKSYSIVTTRSLSEGKAEHPELKLILSTHYSEIKIRDILISHCRTKYSSEIIDESFGKRITCLFSRSYTRKYSR